MNLKKYQAKRSAFTLAVGDVSLSGQTSLGEAEAVGSQFTLRQRLLRWWRSLGLTGARLAGSASQVEIGSLFAL